MIDQLILPISAFALSFALCIIFGRPTIKWLTRQSIQDGDARKASETLNEINQGKSKTPTMGGLFIVFTILVASLCTLPLEFTTHWYILGAIAASAMLGAYDDWIKLTDQRDPEGNRRDGMRGRVKLFWQTLIVGLASFGILQEFGSHDHFLSIPLLGEPLQLGWLALPLAIFVGVGTSNAVNLSDGLDGLASGMMVMGTLAFAAIAFVLGNPGLASDFGIAPLSGASQVAIVAMIVAGACLGFLVYNRHPAKVFMGDTGSLALGTALGLIAISLRQELLLAIIGAVFVAEALSVILQVGYFKLSGGKRIFLCSPLHHHFQFKGWNESKVTRRFWGSSLVCCMIGVGVFLSTSSNTLSLDAAPSEITSLSNETQEENEVDENISVRR